jgi:hypothetical protein
MLCMNGLEPIRIVFYTKPGCHLCDDVADLLEALTMRWPLEVSAINILSDPDLYQRYWAKIPVVAVGEHVLHAPIAPGDLQKAVLRAMQEQA